LVPNQVQTLWKRGPAPLGCMICLIHEFYDTVGRLGAKLSLLAIEKPELFDVMKEAVSA
jgi:hypothetical protein